MIIFVHLYPRWKASKKRQIPEVSKITPRHVTEIFIKPKLGSLNLWVQLTTVSSQHVSLRLKTWGFVGVLGQSVPSVSTKELPARGSSKAHCPSCATFPGEAIWISAWSLTGKGDSWVTKAIIDRNGRKNKKTTLVA